MPQASIFDTECLDPTGNPYRVMVIDDSAVCRKALAQSLERYGFVVLQTSDPKEALERVAAEQPALVLTDIEMPAMDGFDVCMALKDDPRTTDIPVLFVTSNDRPEHKLCGFEAGGSDFIAKNAETMEVIARVRTHAHLASLQQELRNQLVAIREQADREIELRHQIEMQQAQMLQNEKMASIGQLAAGVAHEINNPIGFISSNLNTLNDYVGDLKQIIEAFLDLQQSFRHRSSDVREKWELAEELCKSLDLNFLMDDIDSIIKESVEGTQRVRKIVADLRDFSHVDSPDLTVEDLNELVNKTLNVAHNEIKYKAEVRQELGQVPVLPCYGGKLAQVLLNLIVNAAQAIEDQGIITIRTGTEDEHAWVEVIDNGMGMSAETQKRIFDPFFTTKDVGKGTGLGLHLAYNIMQSHDGSIEVQSELGKGTTFRITLPLAGPADAEDNNTEAPHDQAA